MTRPLTLRQRQWPLVALFVLGLVINYFDRSTLSIGNTEMRRELGLSIGQMGLLLSAFSWAYAVSQLPAGLLVDKIGPRRLLACAVFCWSAAQLAAGFVGFAPAFVVGSAMATFAALCYALLVTRPVHDHAFHVTFPEKTA